MVFPIPSSTKASIQEGKLYQKKGMSIPTKVIALLSWTIVFRPSRFINRAAGTERKRNQMKTIEGMKPERDSLRPKSCLR